MEAGLMEIIWSLNRSGIYDTYFSLNRAIHPGGKVRGECPDTHISNPLIHWSSYTDFKMERCVGTKHLKIILLLITIMNSSWRCSTAMPLQGHLLLKSFN